MQTVPSLVGTGTAVAAAAAGLVFGQPPDSEAPWSSHAQRAFPSDFDGLRLQPAAFPRPSSSAVASLPPPSPAAVDDFPYASFRELMDAAPGPSTSQPPPTPQRVSRPLGGFQVSSPKSSSRRQSFLRSGDIASRPIAENARDSVSSRESWYKRLSSIRPLSQHGSPRSSMGPDSSSMTFSHGSGVPMLGQSSASFQAPNKLVKRTTPGQGGSPGNLSRRGSKSQMFRRPATSHQRSATMQKFQDQGVFVAESVPAQPKLSFDQQPGTKEILSRPRAKTLEAKVSTGRWWSFFHIRTTSSAGRGNAGLGGSSPQTALPPKRVLPFGKVSRAYLTKPQWVTDGTVPVEGLVESTPAEPEHQEIRESPQDTASPSDSADSTPSRRARKSISMHFSSPTSWISKSGSLRRPRRSTVDNKSGGGRHASDPAGTSRDPAQAPVRPALDEIFAPPNPPQPPIEAQANLPDHQTSRRRNSSSPLPPLTRLSSFNIDVARLGISSSSTAATTMTTPRSHPHPINYAAQPQLFPPSRGPSGERSTLASSDAEARDGVSGDEDADLRSDGMYDSFRTAASSSRLRSVDTPIESMFDESPPSTASNSKTKRLSIQEILGRSWDGETKITEEDESLPTPIRAAHLAEPVQFALSAHEDDDDDSDFDAAAPLSLVTRDFGRPSFDDDDDDDWARDDENTLSNHLSPPSSTNSRRVSPTFRQALMDINITDSGAPSPQRESLSDRPRSNIFDWCEPLAHDKYDAGGHSPRPKTVHGKQEMDLRGGRSATRKPPGAAHVRSQSVPVVPDPTETAKNQPKFGTWGLGSKNVSEDWDDDFDFEEVPVGPAGGKDSATSFSMVVPASIQATQPTVRAHSGQIRELSLLVNDLKRLCRHGKDLDILHGAAAAKWKEAQDIIELASPDEEEPEELGSARVSDDFDRTRVADRFLDDGFDGSLLDNADDPFEVPEPEMSRTAVIRSRAGVRRRSVFSPDDDIFGGNWPLASEESPRHLRPRTPESSSPNRSSAIIATVIEAMQQQRSTSDPIKSTTPAKAPSSRLFFDTNSLQELVKRAGQLRDALSDTVRRAELLTQSPAGTPRRERHPRLHNPDGSPAFTRVFTDPAASPPRRVPKTHGNSSVLSKKTSVDSPRMQMMTVS